MATVAEHATAEVFKRLAALPQGTNELTYNRTLAKLWETVVLDLDTYIYERYTAGFTVREHKQLLEKLLKQRPVRQAAVQDFFDKYVSNYERHVTKRIEQCFDVWKERLLATVEEEA